MSMSCASVDTGARTIDEQFLDLILSDEELLASEFDAIIAAAAPRPPVHPPRRDEACDHPAEGGADRCTTKVRRAIVGHRGSTIEARQRSPPTKGELRACAGILRRAVSHRSTRPRYRCFATVSRTIESATASRW